MRWKGFEDSTTNFGLICILVLTGIRVAIALVRPKVVVIIVNIIAVLVRKKTPRNFSIRLNKSPKFSNE